MNKWYFAFGTALLLCSATAGEAQQATEQPAGTKIIIIEEKVDQYGNKTVTKTVKEGNFTDEEINQIIAEESSTENTRTKEGDKGYLGVMIENADNGVRITEVVDGGPGQAAGLKAGDVIVAIGNTEVSNMESLVNAVSSHKPGETVQVQYLRDGVSASLPATLGVREAPMVLDAFEWDEHIRDMKDHESEMKEHEMEMKEHEEKMQLHDKMMKDHEVKRKVEKEKNKPRFGVSIEEAEGDGVVVTKVYEGSLAEQTGLQEGDVITTFNGVEVNTADELIEAVKAAPADDKVKVIFIRDGKKMKEKLEFERT